MLIAGVFLFFLLCFSEVTLVSGATNFQSSLKSVSHWVWTAFMGDLDEGVQMSVVS